jgi:hypothetical protein
MLAAREHQQPDDYRQTGNQEEKAAALPHGKGVACAKQERNSELKLDRQRGPCWHRQTGRISHLAGQLTPLHIMQTVKSAGFPRFERPTGSATCATSDSEFYGPTWSLSVRLHFFGGFLAWAAL